MVAVLPPPLRRALLLPAAALLLVSACTSGTGAAPAPAPSTSAGGSSSPTGTNGPPDATTSAAPGSVPASSVPGSTDPAAGPEFLCQGAEQPRDTADAYTGALSAGSLAQATACVYPGTVPESTTQELLVAGAQGSAYLLDEAASSGGVFVYDGPQGRVDVTVTAQADGHDWVTAVRRE